MKLIFRLIATVFMGLCLAASVHAQGSWPEKPIHFIVPVPPGQSVDILARLLAEKLRPALGQAIVVENRPGAGAMLGTAYAAKQPADGYSFLLAGAGSLSISPHMYKIDYDPLKDFAMINRLATFPMLISVNADLPVKTIPEFGAHSKAKPRTVTYSSSGVGSTQHLIMAMFAAASGADMTHIPYKGSAGSMTDVIGGQISSLADTIPVLAPNVKSGRLRALGITSIKRSPFMPEIPTLDEQGVTGFDVASWAGILAPAGTPTAIQDRMNAEVRKFLRDPEVQKRFQELGMAPIEESRAAAVEFLKKDVVMWGAAVKTSGARAP